MNNLYLWFIIPIVGALIGWFTNYLAVKMLFHPRKPIKFFGLSIQGVFPKRQRKLAEKIGEVVSTELLSSDDLKNNLLKATKKIDFDRILANEIDNIILKKIPVLIPMAAMFLNNEIADSLKAMIIKDIRGSLDNTLDLIGSEFLSSMDIKSQVVEKISNFSSDKLEKIIISVMKKELKFIEVFGAMIGFIIGVVQLVLIGFSAEINSFTNI